MADTTFYSRGTGFQKWAATLTCLDILLETFGASSFNRKMAAWFFKVHTAKMRDLQAKHGKRIAGSSSLPVEIYHEKPGASPDYVFPESADWLSQRRAKSDERPPTRGALDEQTFIESRDELPVNFSRPKSRK